MPTAAMLKTVKTCLIMAPANVSVPSPRRTRIVNRTHQDDPRNYFAIAASRLISTWINTRPTPRLRSVASGGAANHFPAMRGPTTGHCTNAVGSKSTLVARATRQWVRQREFAAEFLERHEASLRLALASAGDSHRQSCPTWGFATASRVIGAGSLFDLHPPLLQAAAQELYPAHRLGLLGANDSLELRLEQMPRPSSIHQLPRPPIVPLECGPLPSDVCASTHV